MLTRPVTRPVVRGVCRNITGSTQRWALNFDGVGVSGKLANRVINPDGDIDIEWVAGSSINFSTSRTIISQTLTTNANAQEFFIFVSTGAGIIVRLGGATVGIIGVRYSANTKYRFLLQGTIIKFWVNDLLVTEQNFTRGTVREPTAVTIIGAAVSSFFYFGALYNVKINGTLWPIADRNQSIQLPEPSGLGAELFSGNTDQIQAGWVYSSGVLTATNVPAYQPSTSFVIPALTVGVQYLVEYVASGQIGSIMAQLFGGANLNLATTSSNGLQRIIFTATGSHVRLGFQATVDNTSTSLSSISLKSATDVNFATIANATSANWVEVPA